MDSFPFYGLCHNTFIIEFEITHGEKILKLCTEFINYWLYNKICTSKNNYQDLHDQEKHPFLVFCCANNNDFLVHDYIVIFHSDIKLKNDVLFFLDLTNISANLLLTVIYCEDTDRLYDIHCSEIGIKKYRNLLIKKDNIYGVLWNYLPECILLKITEYLF